MKPIAVLNLAGRYEKDEIHLSWELPADAPDMVFVCPIRISGMKKTADRNKLRSYSLNEKSFGLILPHRSPTDKVLSRIQYMVFLGERYFAPNLEEMLENPDYHVAVTVGRAKIQYSIKENEVEKGFVQHYISLKSPSAIPFGTLLYSFNMAGQRFSVALPGDVEIGKTEYPPFVTQPSSKMNMRDGSRYGVTLEASKDAKKNIDLEYRRRLSWFSFPF